MNNKIVDLFCGCGGLSKGFEMAGFEVELAIDMWGDAIATYNYNHKNKVAQCVDIHNITNEQLRILHDKGIVGVVGGPPCQGYSTVGTRDVTDPRNHLYLEYCRVVETIQPLFFVLENVKGLTTLSGGAFKNDIISRFEKLGYTVKFAILNAANYGVPQNRERVFFVGIKNQAFVFPRGNTEIVSCSDALSDLPLIDEENGNMVEHDYASAPQNNYQSLMRKYSKVIYNHQITHHSEQTKTIISMIPDGGKIKDLPREYWDIRKYNKAFERI